MKNIRDYFTSPEKSTESSESKKISKDKNVNIVTSSQQSNEENNIEQSNAGKKACKRKKRRKVSDPLVRDVTQLFSHNLSLVSPNNSNEELSSTSLLPESNDTNNLISEDSKIIDSSEKERIPKEEQSINAFQFLMNSRNNVIGQNSKGKIIPMTASPTKEKCENLLLRKKLFKEWADEKGATKRKREEEEVEHCINHKLKKRAKRLKNMLQITNNSNNDIENHHSKVYQKKVKKISSSESENSNDSSMLITNSKVSNLTGINEGNININIKCKTINQNSLTDFVDVVKKDGKIDIFDEPIGCSSSGQKNIIKIKMFTPDSTKKRKSLCSSKKTILEEESQKNSKQQDCNKSLSSKVTRKTKSKETVSVTAENISLNSSENKFKKGKHTEKDQLKTETSERKLRSARYAVNYCELPDKTNSQRKSDLVNGKIKTLVKSTPRKINLQRQKRESLTKTNNVKDIRTTDSDNEIKILSDSDCETLSTKVTKLAPVFLKVVPKPKADPETVEARKQFLMSGVPDSLKKAPKKEINMLEIEYDIFPRVSHIQQKCDHSFWRLSKPLLKLSEYSAFDNSYRFNCQDLITKNDFPKLSFSITSGTKPNLKKILNKIKLENSDYPVYKVFRYINEKNRNTPLYKSTGHGSSKKSKQKLKRSSKNNIDQDTKIVLQDVEDKLWTEKYKPNSSEEILGNHTGITSLRKWLEIWMNYSDEINAKAKKKNGYNSESDFESTDCDSRDSTRLPGNVVVLVGPCGSGKTTAVFSIAAELGFNVLEVNASSKRTGKRLLQELREATQSHQVRKSSKNALAGFVNADNESKSKTKKTNGLSNDEKDDSKKMCILLVEDIDLVFDQDEGFLNSLGQLITTSKRPIILTTTDSGPEHVQRFLSQYESISFMPLYKEVLGVWLQIVCLVEGILLDKNDVGNFLDYNNGDIRKTLLSLQYWCQSGGQLDRNSVFTNNSTFGNDLKIQDDEINLDAGNDDDENGFVHSQCLGSFEIFKQNKQFKIPYLFDLGKIWWNVPNIFNFNLYSERLHRDEPDCEEVSKKETANDSSETQINIPLLLNLYDSCVLTDELYNAAHYCTKGPLENTWYHTVKDSLELTDRKEDIHESVDLIHDMTHTLINSYIEEYQVRYNSNYGISAAVPTTLERRWRGKQHACENFLKQMVPSCNVLDRQAVALDYLPNLRHVARTEELRSSTNTKRRNRFRHYLQDFDIDFNSNRIKSCCNVLALKKQL
ncbi:ATPase family AAA domain-containing protein 5 [Sitophilus oryzae]|uniref:ATPase family AAA domain-containing protein 5 n=1 Tax=Sitophilus oryzae TaxID=7048 RepID=A0A6J2XKZ4_SITOR|nr:ATPase family AAA domain-containing protein 5 [Sitophilus oryzae]